MSERFRAFLQRLRQSARNLPWPARRVLKRIVGVGARFRKLGSADSSDYDRRVAAETAIFADQEVVHDLPPIFHYWSNTWLRPELEAFGFSNPDEFFALHLEKAVASSATEGRPARLASLGCGNCDTEVRVAEMLVARGVVDFTMECVDINAQMLERGRALAAGAGVDKHIIPVAGDFNNWKPKGQFDAVVANQSLHHVQNLERLFAAIETALTAGGRFITSDMIGRNGHMRWPEALSIVHEFWAELPQSYRWNRQLKRQESLYDNWDCSHEGFEGIRAEDILRLLVDRFDFEFFFAFANVIDPFIDRSFGPNFDADAEWDRNFVDRVHRRDEAEILAGNIKPTHMMAVMRRRPYDGECVYRAGLPPQFCMRRTD